MGRLLRSGDRGYVGVRKLAFVVGADGGVGVAIGGFWQGDVHGRVAVGFDGDGPADVGALLLALRLGDVAAANGETIVFWNGGARAILGYSVGRVVGLKCYEVMAGLEDGGLTPDCAVGCACMRYAQAGMVPAATSMMMRCASGARKLVKVQPMVLSGVADSGPLVVYLFDDAAEESSNGGPRWVVEHGSAGGPLTERELEVLRYLALGWDVPHIATEMELSPHTVRNHSTNLRRKLDVTSSLEAVMAGVRMGVLKFDDDGRETDGS